MQRIYLRLNRLAPKGGGEAEGNGGKEGQQRPPLPILPQMVTQFQPNQIDHPKCRQAVDHRRHVEPPRHRPQRQQGKQLAQQQVKRVAGGVSNAKLRSHHLKFKGVGAANGGRHGEQVNGQQCRQQEASPHFAPGGGRGDGCYP